MSHLTPHRHARITHGGSAVSPATAGPPATPDTSWDGSMREIFAHCAEALDFHGDAAAEQVDGWIGQADAIVGAVAERAQVDVDVARTRLRAALLGNVAMLTDLVDVAIEDDEVAKHLMSDPTPEVFTLGRLLILHTDLVERSIELVQPARHAIENPPALDDPVGEGSGGSADPLPEPDVHVGQVAYTPDEVPKTAKGVVIWIGNATTEDDRRARAQAASDLEQDRDEPRKTVVEAIATVLDG